MKVQPRCHRAESCMAAQLALGKANREGTHCQPLLPKLQDLETLAPLGDSWMGDASVVTALSPGRSVVLWSQRPW